MTIVVAPDSFKGTHTAAEVARAIASGVRDEGGAAHELPLADGGEGTLEVLRGPMELELVDMTSVGPWGDPVAARYGMNRAGTAVIELAMASGIDLPSKGYRCPVAADTYGTGLLMADAVSRGAREIVVACGGSATTDGGVGALQALAEAGGTGNTRIVVLADVTTHFVDAARVFGPQKGADADAVHVLSERLRQLAESWPRNPSGVARTGAAGGFAGGMWAHHGASMVSGADFVLDYVGFDAAAREASMVIVGEGRLDSQTGQGKIISAVLSRCGTTPVVACVGSIGPDLGSARDRFAHVRVASTLEELRAAGRELARS